MLDLMARTWFNVTFNGTVPSARFAHDAAVLPESRSMLVFGGRVPTGQLGNGCSNGALAAVDASYSDETWLLRPSSEMGDRSWEPVPRQLPWPPGRAGHTLASTSEGLLMFGGVSPRAGLTTSPTNRGSAPLGGRQGSHQQLLMALNDTWVFAADEERWERVNASQGHAPEPRHSHSSVNMLMPSGPDAASRNTLVESVVIFGGTDNCEVPVISGSHFYNDLWVYTVATATWYKVPPPSGTPPTPRFSHSSAVTGSNTLMIYGGAF